MAPFIHYDGRTLYFSSDTRLGMGGYDLFMSQRDDNGEWKESVNLGYPLNTYGDEINLVVLNDASKAYMSALRKEGNGSRTKQGLTRHISANSALKVLLIRKYYLRLLP